MTMISRWRRPRFARFHFTLYWVSEDVVVTAAVAPTRFGPWRTPSPAEVERLERFAGPMAGWIRQHPAYGDQMVAVVRLVPAGREDA